MYFVWMWHQMRVAPPTQLLAVELAQTHADMGNIAAGTPEELESEAPFDLIINATSLGHEGCTPELAPGSLTPGGLCYDMNYAQAAEPLRSLCREHGMRYSDGLGMLVGQAAHSFSLWTGRTPDTAKVVDILRNGEE